MGTMPLQENTELFLKSLPFFNGLSNADIHDFIGQSNIKKYTKNQAIFLHGDKANHFFIIISGWIKLHRETPEGDEAVIALFTRGDVFGEAAIFSKASYPFSAHAAEESEIIEIPSGILKEKSKENPDILARVMTSMSNEIRQLQLENEHMALMSAPQRVGCLLLQLSAGMIGKGGTFSFPYDKSLAATRLGMKPETFSRSLTQLQPIGITVKGSEITIKNFACLVEYSCGHCSALPGECRKSDCCTYNCAKNSCAKNKQCSA